jgi:uncharacterized membrane protein
MVEPFIQKITPQFKSMIISDDLEKARHSITINKSHQEVYNFFSDFHNLPFFMKDVTSVEVINSKSSIWTVKLPNGTTTEWMAQITVDEPGRMIAWKTVDEAQVEMIGAIWFDDAPANRGTVVRLSMDLFIPDGKFKEFAAKIPSDDPEQMMLTNLRRLKAYVETGEIPTVQGQPSGRDEDMSDEIKH